MLNEVMLHVDCNFTTCRIKWQAMYEEVFQQFGMALGLSILIGLEREQNKKNNGRGHAFAGVRTFGLIGLMGALSIFVADISQILSAFVMLVVFVLIVSAYIVTAFKKGRIGLTTEVSAVVTFVIGVLCAYGEGLIAVVLTLVTLGMLYFKGPLQNFAVSLKKSEMISAIKFMIIAFVVLPLLPNEWMGPYEIFNPYVIWLMVVFISGISFSSYIVIRLLGAKRGIVATGFLAGLISSTALSLDFSKQSNEHKSIVNPYVFAVVVASVASLLRALLIVSVLNRDLLKFLSIPLLAMVLVGLFCAFVFWFWDDADKKHMKDVEKSYSTKSPFRLLPALKFGLLFGVILFATKIAQVYFGDSGLSVVGFFSGILDVDAITVSISNLSKNLSESGSATYLPYVTAITLAAVANSVFKGGLFVIFGSRKAAVRLGISFLLMIFAGLTTLYFL